MRPTFAVTGVGQGWLVRDVLPPAEEVALHDRPLVLQLPSEGAVVVLEQEIAIEHWGPGIEPRFVCSLAQVHIMPKTNLP